MGVCYYLWRGDSNTAYDLGKAYGWGGALGDGKPMVITPGCKSCVIFLSKLLELSLVESGYWKPEDVRRVPIYFPSVVADIARWAEGKPFEFVSENDGRIERAYEGRNDPDSWISGSRFNATILEASERERAASLEKEQEFALRGERVQLGCHNPDCKENGFITRSRGDLIDGKVFPCDTCGRPMGTEET